MTRLTIGGRVFLVSFFLVLAGVVVSSSVSSLVFVSAMRDEMDTTLYIATEGLEKAVEATVTRMQAFGEAFGDLEEWSALVQSGDSAKLNNWLLPYLKVSEFTAITVTDDKGGVLSRPHDPGRLGDNLSDKRYVKLPLQGEKITVLDLMPHSPADLRLFHGTPVTRDGAVIGALVVETDLGNSMIMEQIGKLHGVEATLYYGDTRVNTTIQENGRRIVNTKAAPEVVRRVLNGGEESYAELKLLEKNVLLRTLYRPFVFDGERVGMFSAGVSTRLLNQSIYHAIFRVVGAAVLFLLLAMGLSYVFARYILKLSREKTKQDIFHNLLMKNSPDTILILDEEGKFIACTDIFLQQTGIGDFNKISGRRVEDVFLPFLGEAETRRVSEICGRAIARKESVSFELAVRLSSEDDQRYYSIHFAPMLDKAENLMGFLALFHNLTDLLQAKQAEASSQAKSTFLAIISHEIRTPLNAILGLSEVELRNSLPVESRENLEKIYASGSILLGIINDILDISKIEAGHFTLVPVKYDFPSLVNDAISLNIVRIGSKSILFEVQVDEDIPVQLYGDELRVKQILNNLLSNAFKYTEHGTVTLEISCEREGNDAWFTYTVRDTGKGIRQEDVGKLFTEYRRMDMATNRGIEGTGLGLSICKNLVEMMDGTITVESKYGKGSTFRARLRQEIIDPAPIGEETVSSLKTFRFTEVSYNKKKIVRSPMPYGKVLVVDDVPTNLDVARGLMIPYDLTVHTASSGKQAVEIVRFEKERYDAIFMDHMMPEIDGIEAVRIIRKEIGTEYARNVPIIALTANAMAGNADMFLQNGFQDFLPKPVDTVRLDMILNRWVRDRQAPQARGEAGQRIVKNLSESSGLLASPGFQVEGIDLQAGLQRFDNNEAIYLALLQSYVTHTSDLLDEIRTVSKDSLPRYAIEVHGLKGASYGICAFEVGKLAEELEVASKKWDYEFVEARHGTFIAVVEQLLKDLGSLLEKLTKPLAGKNRKRLQSPDRKLLTELLEACFHFKMSEIKKIIDELESYSYESDADLVPWLRDQAENLEYENIQKRLEEFLA